MSAESQAASQHGGVPWPSAEQFNEAIQNLSTTMGDEELRGGTAALDRMGLPLLYSGGFADVYKVDCPATQKTWAVKCFTKGASGLRGRYKEISRFLEQQKLGFTVGFEYQDRGIRIQRSWYPIVKMHWIEGLTLNDFVMQCLDQPNLLSRLITLWVRLSARLHNAGMAHADLQHGNVMLVPSEDQGQLLMRLIDYDGMWIPSLAKKASGEVGHRNYQHPQRAASSIYSVHVDRFSHLTIACALQALQHEGLQLWDRYHNEDNLLLVEQDFLSPENSPLLRELWGHPDVNVRNLAGYLILGTKSKLAEVPYLHQLVDDHLTVLPLSAEATRRTEAILNGSINTTSHHSANQPASPEDEFAIEFPLRGHETAAEGQSRDKPHDPNPTDPPKSDSLFGERPEFIEAELEANGPPGSNQQGVEPSLGWLGSIDRSLAEIAGGSNTVFHHVLRVASVGLPTTFASTILLGSAIYLSNSSRSANSSREGTERTASLSTEVIPTQPLAGLSTSNSPPESIPEPPPSTDEAFLVNTIGMHFSLIEPGSFQTEDEVLQSHVLGSTIEITRSFFIGVHEVTQAQYREVMEESPSRFVGDERPVEQVSALDADRFCELLTERERSTNDIEEGFQYRLPTRAEWEFAARASGQLERSSMTAWTHEHAGGQSHQVGQLKPNAWGLYDMLGNVDEWLLDEAASLESLEAVVCSRSDPMLLGYGGLRRMLHGGSWKQDSRGSNAANTREADIGFRILLAIPPTDRLAIELNEALARRDHTSAVELLREIESRRPDDSRLPVWRERMNQLVTDHRTRVDIQLNSLGMQIIRIKAGEFPMGSDEGASSSQPPHRVKISNDFFLGMKEVTQAEFDSIMEGAPFSHSTLPALVTHASAVEFCERLTELEKAMGQLHGEFVYRLPSEAEWEYAARAGSGTLWFFGDDDQQAPFYVCTDPSDHVHSVGQRLPNPWGLFDMVGNASEWTLDGFLPDYTHRATDAVSTDPLTLPDQLPLRVVRGGRSGQDLMHATSARRVADGDQARHGFRIALAMPIERLFVDSEEVMVRNLESALAQDDGQTASHLLDRLERIIPSDTRLESWKQRLHDLDDPERSVPAPPSEIYAANALGMPLVKISPGEFLMGSDDGAWNESPRHLVRISRPYFIGIHEVTQQQYETVMRDNPSRFKGPNLPVENVSFWEAEEFCRRLTLADRQARNILARHQYRLPTEAEWEYAARAGTDTPWICGNSPFQLDRYAWYAKNAQQRTHPVGSKRPNAWGLYDVMGNVFEWTMDMYVPDVYETRAQELQVDPVVPGSRAQGSDAELRVDRGGSWHRSERYCRSANRNGRDPALKRSDLGFRIVLVDNPESP